jgi:hypothetical protein
MHSRNISLTLIVERTGGRPIIVTLPSLVDDEVTIDEAGRCTSSMSARWRRIAGAPSNPTSAGNGRWAADHDSGRTYHVRRFAVQSGQPQIRNGRLELPNTQQRPGIPVLKGNN